MRYISRTYVCINLAYTLCLNISAGAKALADILMHFAAFLQQSGRAYVYIAGARYLLLSVYAQSHPQCSMAGHVVFMYRCLCDTCAHIRPCLYMCKQLHPALASLLSHSAWPPGSPDFNKSWIEEAAGGERNSLFL